MQIELDGLEITIAILFIFGGLVFLILSQRIVEKVTEIELIYPNDPDYQNRIKSRNKRVSHLTLQYIIMIILELFATGIGGFLLAGYAGLSFFIAVIFISHYQNRNKVPKSNYDPLDNLMARTVMIDVHGNTTSQFTKSVIFDFISERKLSPDEITELLDYLFESGVLTKEDSSDLKVDLVPS